MRVIGLMSGTSYDAIDVANVDFRFEGGTLEGTILSTAEWPLSAQTRERIRRVLPPRAANAKQLLEVDTELGQLFAQAVVEAVRQVDADAVCSHGQTIYHWVEDGHALASLQVANPAWIAESTGLPVVSDLRMRDVVSGGQGAPLVSFLDSLLLGGRGRCPAALNLGGIANLTVVRPGATVVAWDVGPAGALVDAVVAARRLNDLGYDEGGRIAASGDVVPGLLESLLADPYYARPAPKSTGKEVFHLGYVQAALERYGKPVSTEDLVATLTALTARAVAESVLAWDVDYLAVSGGGARNPVVMAQLRELLPNVKVTTSADLGAPPDAKEAILCALIGWCTLHNVPATLPGVTGAKGARVLGSITPGEGPLLLGPAPGVLDSLRLCRGPASGA